MSDNLSQAAAKLRAARDELESLIQRIDGGGLSPAERDFIPEALARAGGLLASGEVELVCGGRVLATLDIRALGDYHAFSPGRRPRNEPQESPDEPASVTVTGVTIGGADILPALAYDDRKRIEEWAQEQYEGA